MTKSSIIAAILGAVILVGGLIVAMGVLAFPSRPNRPTGFRSLALGSICIAIGGVPIMASVIALFVLARNSYRALAVTATTVAEQPLLSAGACFDRGSARDAASSSARPGFVTFLPMEPIKHLLGEMAKSMALHVVGVQEIQLMEPKQILEWIDSLRESNPGKFDLEILRGAERRGAITWRAAEVEVAYDAESLAAKKFISFRSGKAMINFMRKLDVEQQQFAGELCLAMARRAMTLRLPRRCGWTSSGGQLQVLVCGSIDKLPAACSSVSRREGAAL